KTRSATTSLGAGRNSLMMGLISCGIFLKENPAAKVLLIAADHKVPEVFAKSLNETNQPWAMAMWLGNESVPGSLRLDFTRTEKKTPESSETPQGIEFLSWFFESAMDA